MACRRTTPRIVGHTERAEVLQCDGCSLDLTAESRLVNWRLECVALWL